jgi:hypothetical protein
MKMEGIDTNVDKAIYWYKKSSKFMKIKMLKIN